jgi:aminoglycoside phosphotransferase family enzyme/predicted kinase
MRTKPSVSPRRPLHLAQREHAAQRGWRRVDDAMQRAGSYRHPAGQIRRIETHISVIYLAGRFAYKVKKPVNPGFVDLTRPAARLRYCNEEVRLNRRLAHGLYLDVLPIVATGRSFRVGGPGKAAAHAVKMRRFAEADVFSHLLGRGELGAPQITRLASRLAAFHGRVSCAQQRNAPRTAFGSSALVHEQMTAVLNTLEREAPALVPVEVRLWCQQEAVRLAPHFDARRRMGFVRECHGDLHLDNIMQKGSDIVMFDCIEFSDALRWIDVASDLAFPLMDLKVRGRDDLAAHLLNDWLQFTGDFGALSVLRFYMVYRALVRALVAMLKAPVARTADVDASARAYVAFAGRTVRVDPPYLLLCHGYSGSGKSVASAALAPLIGAVRLSSDVERKREQPLSPPVFRTLPAAAYTSHAIHTHYIALLAKTRDALLAGYPMLVDATFLKERDRRRFIELASALSMPVFLLDFHAGPRTLVERVRERASGPFEASDAGTLALVRQLANEEPLSPEECLITISFDTDVPLNSFGHLQYWRPLIEQLNADSVAPREAAIA